jgi:predicted RNase H-like nuclease (RuvC/YqgF family)
MSLTKDVQSLLKDQRITAKKNLARDKDVTDVGTEVDRLTRETASLQQQNIELTRDVNALVREKQEAEKMDLIRDNKINSLEKKIEELTQQTSVLDQRNQNLTQEIVALKEENLTSKVIGDQCLKFDFIVQRNVIFLKGHNHRFSRIF